MKKYSEKVTSFGGEKDKLKKFLDSFSRNLCWFIGMTSYKLIRVKEEKEGDKKEAAPNDKMQDLIIQSSLLSGGIENRFITQFSPEAQTLLQDLVKISDDKKLLELLNAHNKATEEDNMVSAVINQG